MESASFLANTQLDWLAANFNIPSYCAYETQRTYGVLIVTQASATNLCNKALDPIDADHISIVKPAGIRDIPYLAFKSAYQQVRPHAALSSQSIRLANTTSEEPSWPNHKMTMETAPPYELLAKVHVSFRTTAFNQSPYLAGLDSNVKVLAGGR
jgi:hypothetical protein